MRVETSRLHSLFITHDEIIMDFDQYAPIDHRLLLYPSEKSRLDLFRSA